MLSHAALEKFLLSLPQTWLDYPFGEGVAVYKTAAGKMFALVQEGSDPLQVSLKADPNLSRLLRDKYESVSPGYHLNKKHWNTILLTGQLADDEVIDLARHSYELVAG
ncbi:MAG: MmcQ/YjbR family DNA-binding protein [Candidatus Nomurabacteria bacterium]|jgi:predicted DNA-binding protein (MmcQ/YjbR family)|nr:MmcQ/YjbR family DNA-binding protein [Candidatus Nomurabacteria bacterium]